MMCSRKKEIFDIELEEPVSAALEHPLLAQVAIIDKEDESTVFIPEETYEIDEDIGRLEIPIKRKGDISKEMMVICSTEPGTAQGTSPLSIVSFTDYISRPENHKSIIHFQRGEDLQFCKLIIIDDSLYEDEETFTVKLTTPLGGRLGDHNQTTVKILSDVKDVPSIYFGDMEQFVDESDGYVEVLVWRTGTDLSRPSTITVQSRPSEPITAEAGLDYIGVGRNLDFAPGVTMQTFRVTILDDLGKPLLEGPESFELLLRMPMNAVLGTPDKMVVVINDSTSDLPKFQFKDSAYIVFENDSRLNTVVTRNGDLKHSAAVRCYTRQMSAKAYDDFEERPNTDDSLIVFQPDENEKLCSVNLVDDTFFEGDEEFRLVLGSPISDSAGGAILGHRNATIVTIKDINDKSVIRLQKNRYTIKEPQNSKESSILQISVLRTGDLSKLSLVRAHTKDGSAKSGLDYVPYSK
ncbi:FRAS1-related extracellular matrix protein 2, partial [Caerostris extrusa]